MASAANRLTILSLHLVSIHRFINTHNATALQADCTLTYAGHNIYLLTPFFKDLLQGHILVIFDPDAPTGLYPLITPLSSATQQTCSNMQQSVSAHNAGSGPASHGSRLTIQGQIYAAHEPMGLCGHNNSKYLAPPEDLCVVIRRLTWTQRTDHQGNVNGDLQY